MLDATVFAARRAELFQGAGVPNLRGKLTAEGWVTPEGTLSTGTTPFNPFARLVAGLLPMPYGDLLQQVGISSSEFMVARNRPELAAAWASNDPAMVGKAGMSEHHEFLLLRDLWWETFNVLTFAAQRTPGAYASAIDLLDRMEVTALEYARRSGWSPNVGLFFHCYPQNSVQALHLHIVDWSRTGPTYDALDYKNLKLSDVRLVLQQEAATL